MKEKICAVVMRDCDSKPEITRFDYFTIPEETLRVYADTTPLDLLVNKYTSEQERQKKSFKIASLKHINSSSYFALIGMHDVFINPAYFNQPNVRKELMKQIIEWQADVHAEKLFPRSIMPDTLNKECLDDFFRVKK